MTRSDRWKKRPCVVRYWNFKNYLQEQAKFQNFKLSNNIEIFFELKIPKSWSKKKKHKMLYRPHQQKPDIDNLVKAVLDSLAEKNDSYINALSANKVWADEGKITIINN